MSIIIKVIFHQSCNIHGKYWIKERDDTRWYLYMVYKNSAVQYLSVPPFFKIFSIKLSVARWKNNLVVLASGPRLPLSRSVDFNWPCARGWRRPIFSDIDSKFRNFDN